MSWETSLKSHWGVIAAAHFFNVEVLTQAGLIRYLVFFLMDLRSRRVEIAGIHPEPDGRWTCQVARNLTGTHNRFLTGSRHLNYDRDPVSGEARWRAQVLLPESGVMPLE